MIVQTDPRAPRVVLVGPPGAGKSTIGRRLAKELGVELYDTDVGIERETGRTIPEIFATDGEPEFRKIEERVVRRAILAERGVVSLGGGAVLSKDTRALLRNRTVVYLEISVGEGLRRTGASTSRPLLNGADPAAKYRELMRKRRPLYREVATVRVRTDGRSPGRVVKMVLAKLGFESVNPGGDADTDPPELAEPTITPDPTPTGKPQGGGRSRARRRARARAAARRATTQEDNPSPHTNNAAAQANTRLHSAATQDDNATAQGQSTTGALEHGAVTYGQSGGARGNNAAAREQGAGAYGHSGHSGHSGHALGDNAATGEQGTVAYGHNGTAQGDNAAAREQGACGHSGHAQGDNHAGSGQGDNAAAREQGACGHSGHALGDNAAGRGQGADVCGQSGAAQSDVTAGRGHSVGAAAAQGHNSTGQFGVDASDRGAAVRNPADGSREQATSGPAGRADGQGGGRSWRRRRATRAAGQPNSAGAVPGGQNPAAAESVDKSAASSDGATGRGWRARRAAAPDETGAKTQDGAEDSGTGVGTSGRARRARARRARVRARKHQEAHTESEQQT